MIKYKIDFSDAFDYNIDPLDYVENVEYVMTDLEETLANIAHSKIYVDKYYSMYRKQPQWVVDRFIKEPTFDEWYTAEIRNEKIDNILK